jgi:hypothetical protein
MIWQKVKDHDEQHWPGKLPDIVPKVTWGQGGGHILRKITLRI